MKSLVCIALALAAPAATAGPPDRPQDPRAGLLAELEFSPGSARLPESSRVQLGRIAGWAGANFDGVVVVHGHADPTGPARADIRLSLRRARLVRDELVSLGVNPMQIVIAAFDAETERRLARVSVWGTANEDSSVHERWTSWPMRRASSSRSSGPIQGTAIRATSVP